MSDSAEIEKEMTALKTDYRFKARALYDKYKGYFSFQYIASLGPVLMTLILILSFVLLLGIVAMVMYIIKSDAMEKVKLVIAIACIVLVYIAHHFFIGAL